VTLSKKFTTSLKLVSIEDLFLVETIQFHRRTFFPYDRISLALRGDEAAGTRLIPVDR